MACGVVGVKNTYLIELTVSVIFVMETFSGTLRPDGMVDVAGHPEPLPAMILNRDSLGVLKAMLEGTVEAFGDIGYVLNPFTNPIYMRINQLIEAEREPRMKRLDAHVRDLFCAVGQDFAYYARFKYALGVPFESYDTYWLKIANDKSLQLDLSKLYISQPSK